MFNSPTKGELTVEEVIGDVSNFVKDEPGSYYRLVIGTDSQIKSVGESLKLIMLRRL